MKKLFFFLLLLVLAACSDYSSTTTEEKKVSSVKVAVILPLDKEAQEHWKNTAKWFEENLKRAFENIPSDSSFTLDIEWFDENTADMDELAESLTSRSDIPVIIGPMHALKLDTLAQALAMSNQNGGRQALIAPMTSAAETVRRYADKDWFFSLTETDVAESDIMLGAAHALGGQSVSLLASESENAKTFEDWIGFQATEQSVKINDIETYCDSSDVEEVANRFFAKEHNIVICVPNKPKDVIEILKASQKNKSKAKILFNDNALQDILLKENALEGADIFSVGANPESGFEIAYATKFNKFAKPGNAQFYDALMATALAQMLIWNNEDVHYFSKSLAKVFAPDSTEDNYLAWEPIPLSRIFGKIQKGKKFNIAGASGNLDIERTKGGVVLQTFYTHWNVINKQFVPIEYFSSNGSKRTSSSTISYNWIASFIISQIPVDSNTSDLSFYPKEENFALLIATSSSWLNYRHQADILTLYQKLKANGFDDKHIILIMEDDLAQNASNPKKGTLINYEGEMVYKDIQLDYRASELSPEDLFSIFLGEKSERLPQVLESDSTHNVFVFWSGHGKYEQLDWPKSAFTYSHMQNLVEQMAAKKKFRKMLWMVEACYSGSVCKAFDDISAKGSMCITAANERETSKAVIFNQEYRAYMTNSFSMNFLNYIKNIKSGNSENKSFAEIYNDAAKNTLGSHVSIYNLKNFGNLRSNGIREFIVP